MCQFVYASYMSVQLTVTVPDDLMEWLAGTAERNFRTPEGQVLWLIRSARGENRRGRDGEAKRALSADLRKLHEDAGMPSVRAISERIEQQGGNVSHSTVHAAIKGNNLPSWANVESIVTALGGDVEHFRDLTVRAHGGRQNTEDKA
jgi:hypothetical protein